MEAAALSIAIMAPTAAMALNGSLSASYAGPATTLAFLLAFVTILLVSYAFTQFAKQYATAGSVYRFNVAPPTPSCIRVVVSSVGLERDRQRMRPPSGIHDGDLCAPASERP